MMLQIHMPVQEPNRNDDADIKVFVLFPLLQIMACSQSHFHVHVFKRINEQVLTHLSSLILYCNLPWLILVISVAYGFNILFNDRVRPGYRFH